MCCISEPVMLQTCCISEPVLINGFSVQEICFNVCWMHMHHPTVLIQEPTGVGILTTWVMR
jgi:hypothetical protein